MNITHKQFVFGLERSIKAMNEILDTKQIIDNDLWEEYLEQFDWMFNSIPNVENEIEDLTVRLKTAKAEMASLKSRLDILKEQP